MFRLPGRLALFLALLAVGLLAAPAALAQEAKTFRWKFQPGDRFQVRINQDTSLAAGPIPAIGQSMTFDAVWQINTLDPQGVAKINQTIDRVRVAMQTPLGKIEYDSSSEQPPEGLAVMFAKTFEPLIGAPFEQTMNNRGKVIDVKVPEGFEQALKANPQAAAQGLSKESLTRNVQQGSPVFPEEPIAVGGSWENESDMDAPAGGKMKVKSKYTYVGKEEKLGRMLDRFDIDMTIALPEGGAATPLGQMAISEQSGKGALYFDSEQGYLVGSQLDQKVVLAIKSPQGEIKQNVNSNIKMIVKPAE